MHGKTDSMPSNRKRLAEKLYQYFVEQGVANKKASNESTSEKYPTIANKDVTCVVDGSNYKIGPFKVTKPSDSVNYTITLTDGTSELLSSAYTIKDKDGKEISDAINKIFDKDYYVYIPVAGNKIATLNLNVEYTKTETKASVWQTEENGYQPLVLLTKEATKYPDKVSVNIKKVNYDLALRKYIIKVDNTEYTDRKPTETITDDFKNGKTTTAEYKHKKDAITVNNGSKITYRIVVYNEGDVDASATKIVDYLPAGLELDKDDETNKIWTASEDGTYITTDALKDTTIPAFGEKLTGAYIDVVCKVTDNAASGSILTNIAEIQDDNIEDRDSTTDSIKEKIASIDKANYKGNEKNKSDLSDSNYYYQGQEDDDDFEKVIVAGKAFDLSLQKFITKVNGKAVSPSREPKVDTSPLKNSSENAKYEQVKTPIVVSKGDIVTYTIRVYNEGEVDGYAEKVADYLPAGLGFLVNYKANINNSWKLPDDLKNSAVKIEDDTYTKNLKVDDFDGVTKLSDITIIPGAVKLTSTLLSSSDSKNLIKAFDGSDKLDYKDIEITCVVLADSNLTNIAEVVEHSDKNKNKEVKDRDSTPDTVNPDKYPGDDEKQDDNDYETLVTKKFDLALQKFISGLNDKEVKDREPKATIKDGKISYEHTQTPLEVNNGDTVVYTIRVYNEGEMDGYAAEVADDIPDGLQFIKDNEINKKYGWVMLDSNGKETDDVSKAKEIRTDYLSKEKSQARKDDALIKAFDSEKGTLSYMDVKVAFKINTKSANATITNTAEITKNTDPDGNEVKDVDSTPDNKKDGEDDLDKERVHVGYFDLALKKDLTKAVVTEGNSTKEIQAVNGQLTKVEIHRKKVNSTIVKFVYNITITNEGTIPGYATEIKDYIPQGLQFVEADNKGWKAGTDGTITTNNLAKTLLQPGESASVEVVLRWINGESNLGLKTNIAEISEDYNEANDVDDIDSTPNNKKDGEDDIDDAPVILSISTGKAPIYIALTTGVLTIISAGVVGIKKYVL